MTVVIAALASGMFVAGLLYVIHGLLPHPEPLDKIVAELHRPRVPRSATGDQGIGIAGLTLSASALMAGGAKQQDLDVCGYSAAKWLSNRLTWAGLGSAPAFLIYLMTATGVWSFVPVWLAALALPVGLVAGWFYAVVDLRSSAERSRQAMRHAVAAYLELVTILMAGGAGPESAMYDAADVGEGIAFQHIRSALASAQVRREDPWIGLGRVGHELGVRELVELEATMRLAAGGAKVKTSLVTKAVSIRERSLAQLESEAEAKSETMVLPVVLMFAGFMVLLGYPALAGLAST